MVLSPHPSAPRSPARKAPVMAAQLSIDPDTYTVTMVPNPSPNTAQPWLPGAVDELPALCVNGRPHRYLGAGVGLDEAVAKAEGIMARWAKPRTVIARKDHGDVVELTAATGEVIG